MEKKKKVRVSFDVDVDMYNNGMEAMFERKMTTNKSEFFRQMINLGVNGGEANFNFSG